MPGTLLYPRQPPAPALARGCRAWAEGQGVARPPPSAPEPLPGPILPPASLAPLPLLTQSCCALACRLKHICMSGGRHRGAPRSPGARGRRLLVRPFAPGSPRRWRILGGGSPGARARGFPASLTQICAGPVAAQGFRPVICLPEKDESGPVVGPPLRPDPAPPKSVPRPQPGPLALSEPFRYPGGASGGAGGLPPVPPRRPSLPTPIKARSVAWCPVSLLFTGSAETFSVPGVTGPLETHEGSRCPRPPWSALCGALVPGSWSGSLSASSPQNPIPGPQTPVSQSSS